MGKIVKPFAQGQGPQDIYMAHNYT